ncbi:hypothetical protein T01_16026 [Trichinella spiralis]|uniref:Uncharacterized protein n=1 Tax=Trichinella spiralis TaxID=6334 RepID=A0A0V1BIE7_TRISP|nr:hypothetical protein T01_16026 [Trichinella spiralis]
METSFVQNIIPESVKLINTGWIMVYFHLCNDNTISNAPLVQIQSPMLPRVCYYANRVMDTVHLKAHCCSSVSSPN